MLYELIYEKKSKTDTSTQLYDDLAIAERERYIKEMTNTFGTTRPVASA